jgi:undecaprenyl diphosphate synthase
MKTIDDIDKTRLPKHVAIIMDGNGRWAQKQSKMRIFGHQNATQAVREAVEAAARLEIGYLTLYTFSTENWNRPQAEVDGLMKLLVKTIHEETPTLMKNNVRLRVIGETERLPKDSLQALQQIISTTEANNGTTLTLALSYSSRWEVAKALKAIVDDAAKGAIKKEDVDEETLRKYLATSWMPDPDLLIRTGGELRISNFLLWQMAYTEFYFSDILWPDFRQGDFYEAVYDYQNRQRRFGKTGDQVAAQ